MSTPELCCHGLSRGEDLTLNRVTYCLGTWISRGSARKCDIKGRGETLNTVTTGILEEFLQDCVLKGSGYMQGENQHASARVLPM